MIPPGFIQDLLARVDIVEVVGRHVELKKAGINHKGLCPFHGEKSPSFIVSPTRQTYHCFGCGVHGNAVGFLMEHTGAGFVEAVEDLAQQVGMQVPQDQRSPEERQKAQEQKARQSSLTELLERAAKHYQALLKKSPRAIDYLKRRGLTGQIAKQFGLGYSPEGWRTLASAVPDYADDRLVESGMVIESDEDKRYDRFRDRIMFPIRNVQGETIGFGGRVLDKGEPKYLNSPETPVFSKGRELYGLYEARTELRRRGYVLVVEGYMDVVALAQSGFGNAVATLGTACTAEHVQKLFRFTESVVFSFDGDAAGRRAAGRALEAALPHASDTRSIKFLFLPTEHDPDSYVREFGADAFERCVEEAIPLSRQLMEVAAEGSDLGTAEGRARLLSNARPLWNALPAGLLKRQLLGDLARRAQLPEQELMALWPAGAPAERAPARPRQHQQQPHQHAADDEHPGWHDSYEPDPADFVAEPSATYDVAQPAEHEPQQAWKPRKTEWKKDWKPSGGGGKWKGRREPEDETLGMPRARPAQPADNALRMLLLSCDWWEQLSPDDQQLLHALPGSHGELIAWLERYLVNHGAVAWSVLEQALRDDGLLAGAERTTGGLVVQGELKFDQMQEVMRQLWILELKAQTDRMLAAGNLQGEALERFRQLHEQLRQLRAAVPA
ncbi:DNA primase [Pelomonas sp. KK5]|uniref:DNA primase n=1 Tax=Pelomonas sp. KK5 TaxID=1855730 RepID=UPI00097BAAEA|nr:DNA primase [Pelomonas sp. KK5]